MVRGVLGPSGADACITTLSRFQGIVKLSSQNFEQRLLLSHFEFVGAILC